MMNELAMPDAKLYESLALKGDISGLSAPEKIHYYATLCERLGLDPYTQPFTPLRLNGKEILYATRAATDQLARIHGVTRRVMSRERLEDVYVVTVQASLPNGRTEDAIGAVPLGGLKGEALANALMKAETKAKRRATLAILGLGMLDESELETIPKTAMAPVPPSAFPPIQAEAEAEGEVVEPSITEPQIKKIAVLLREIGADKDRTLSRQFCGLLLGREVSSIKELSKAEASELIELLSAPTAGETWSDFLNSQEFTPMEAQ